MLSVLGKKVGVNCLFDILNISERLCYQSDKKGKIKC